MVTIPGVVTIVKVTRPYTPAFLAIMFDTLIGNDGDGKADPGETLNCPVTLSNSGTVPVADNVGITFNNATEANIPLIIGSVTVSPFAGKNTYP